MKTKMPAFLNKAEKTFPTREANENRFITKIRWIVKSTNGRVKTWRLLDRVLPNSIIPVAGDLLSIVCALINAYRPLFIKDISKDDEIADAMIARVHQNNKLKDYMEKMKYENQSQLKRVLINATTSVPDFPQLTLK